MFSTKCVYQSYVFDIYMHKQDLVLNNLQYLICYKTKPNETKLNFAQSAAAVEYTDCTSA